MVGRNMNVPNFYFGSLMYNPISVRSGVSAHRGVDEDPAHRILSCRDPSGWSMPRGRPHASWLRQVESYLKDAGMTGLASAWAMGRRRPKEYGRKVDAATRCSGVCPHT